jgi:hypothetical protein
MVGLSSLFVIGGYSVRDYYSKLHIYTLKIYLLQQGKLGGSR